MEWASGNKRRVEACGGAVAYSNPGPDEKFKTQLTSVGPQQQLHQPELPFARRMVHWRTLCPFGNVTRLRSPRNAWTWTSEESRQEKPGCVQKTDFTIDRVSLKASSAHANDLRVGFREHPPPFAHFPRPAAMEVVSLLFARSLHAILAPVLALSLQIGAVNLIATSGSPARPHHPRAICRAINA